MRRPRKKAKAGGGKLADGLRFLARAVKSATRRYQRPLARALGRRGHTKAEDVRAFREAWSAMDDRAGLQAAAWLGHCTVLLKIGGLTVLTDPVLSHEIGMKIGRATVGLTRLCPVPIGAHELPRVDLILLSHAHFDHLDKPTLAALKSRHTRVITASRTKRLIPRGFGEVKELAWGGAVEVEGLKIEAVRPRHWGARTAWDRHRGYNGYLIRTGAQTVFFAGDTAYTEKFTGLGPVDLAVFGIGAYDPWEHAHATPEQVWKMCEQVEAKWVLPVHHSTFALGDEGEGEPMERLLAAAGKDARCVLAPKMGEIVRW